MKLRMVFVVGFLACAASAAVAAGRTFYVDAAGGNDAADGLSEATAWKSPVRVSKEVFKAGDRVLFRAGCTWRLEDTMKIRGEGTAEAPIVVSRYGEGPRPEFRGSVDGTAPGFWTALSNGLWTASAGGRTGLGERDVGNIVCVKKGESPARPTCGWKRWHLTDVVDEADYFHDLKAGVVYFKSARNPSEVYSRMELCRKVLLMNVASTKWVRVRDLSFAYTGSHGICGAPVQHLKVSACVFGWIGGSLLGMWPDGRGGTYPVRYGNGIEFWTSALNKDIRLENNEFYEVYDTAMTNQGNTEGVLDGMVICSNRTWNCEQSYEIWFTSTNYLVKSIELFGNRFEETGYGWSHAQRPDKNATHLLAYGFKPQVESISYHDNYFGRTKDCMFWWFSYPTINHVRLDRNTYCQPGIDLKTSRGMFRWQAASGAVENPTYDDYRKATGYDAHSRFLTPEEKDPAVREMLARRDRQWLALPNGDFESPGDGPRAGLSGWSVTEPSAGPNCKAVADGEVRHGGKRALRIESRKGERIQVARNVNVRNRKFKPGRKYRLGVWLRAKEGSPRWSCDFGVYTPELKGLYNHAFASPEPGEWRYDSVVFTLPGGGDILRVMFNFRDGAVGWLDDLTLEEELPDGTFRELHL